jgi:lytic murein transglycosylase
MKKHAGLLRRIEERYGVPGAIIVAVWGRESGFGRAKIPHNAVRVIATKAFMSTRPELFRREILAALKILQRGDVPASALKGSWAGAMGQPQFLPSSYLDHAVDFDGDGKIDIWNSTADSLASIGNYLAKSGWVRGRDWGFEAVIPEGVTCALEGPDRARPISALTDMGIIRISGRPFPEHERRAPGMVLVPAGIYGPEFVVTPNFYVIKEYNNSDLYALFIGNLADRMAYGGGAFVTRWQNRRDAALGHCPFAVHAGKTGLRCGWRRWPARIQDKAVDRRVAGEERPETHLLPDSGPAQGGALAILCQKDGW